MSWTLGSSTAWVVIAAEVIPFNGTAIRLASFDAQADGRQGVALRWRTGGERGTLGFRMFRENADGELVQINRELIAGSGLISRATLRAGYSYAWRDPAGTAGDRYWLVEVEIDGNQRRYGPFTAEPAGRPIDEVASSPTLAAVAQPTGESVPRAIPSFTDNLKADAQGDLERQLALAAEPGAVKIGVSERGWYRVTSRELLEAGLSPPRDAANLQLYTSGRQVPMIVTTVGEGHSGLFESIAFYGVGVDEAATDTRVYWLVEGNEPGLRVASDASGPIGTELVTLPYTIELRERLVYVASFANGDDSNFYGAVLIGDPVERTLSAAALDVSAAGPAELELVLRGFSDGRHDVRVEVNGTFVADLEGVDQEEIRQVVPLEPGILVEGDNVVRLTPGSAEDISLVDVIGLQYPRRSVATGDELLASVPDDVTAFVVDGFSRPWARVLEVSDPFDVVELGVGAARDGGDRVGLKSVDDTPGYQAVFRLPAGTERVIHAIGPDRVLEPDWIVGNEPSTWSVPDNGAEVLMVVPRTLADALQPLVAFREAQGHSVAMVAVEDAYDERSYGIKRPAGIRDLVADAVSHWDRAPEVLILVGDASYDPRNFLGLGNADLVPTKFVATDTFEAASDDWFADVDGDSFPDLVVGRLPVKDAAGLAALVSKTIAYEQDGTEWTEAVYVSDEDMGSQFEGSSNLLMSRLPSVAASPVLVRELGNQGAQDAVIAALNSGVDLVSYVGHGSVQTWSGNVLGVDVVDQISPDADPAVFTMMNCMNGYFFDAALDSLSEALLASGGGAIAVFASTGITGWAPQEPMMVELYDALENAAAGTTLGEAVLAAKQAAGSNDVRQTWVILGDPMITVR